MDVTFSRIAFSYRDVVCRSYRRRFPVVYLTLKAMRRPRFVDKQLEVCAFFVYICHYVNPNNRIAKVHKHIIFLWKT